MTLEELVAQPWQTTVEADLCHGKPCYVARNPELGSCIGQGDTPEQALASLSKARRDLLKVMLDFGDPIPEPIEWQRLTCDRGCHYEYRLSVAQPTEIVAPLPENPSLVHI